MHQRRLARIVVVSNNYLKQYKWQWLITQSAEEAEQGTGGFNCQLLGTTAAISAAD